MQTREYNNKLKAMLAVAASAACGDLALATPVPQVDDHMASRKNA